MVGVFARSWELTKLSFRVMQQDKELLLFPLCGGIFSLLFIVVILFPTIIVHLINGVTQEYGLLEYGLLFFTYLGLSFIATFFNVCVVYTTKQRFSGKNATFTESLGFALKKLPLILQWSLVAATVGLLLRMLEQLGQGRGRGMAVFTRILASLFGMMWSIVTIFVVPGMVYYNLGPFAAIKRSFEILQKTWGESLIRYYGLGLMEFLFLILGFIIAVVLFFALSVFGLVGIFIALTFAVLYFLAVILIFNVANSVFNTVLFIYADTGKVPKGYDPETLKKVFQGRPRHFGGIVP
ncbi:hypothetical protein HYW21_03315 [Candidatus Woesearchaeota archaeon]|nr:hypothetical protein [Candidatus Woesearchaeota archaeon]